MLSEKAKAGQLKQKRISMKEARELVRVELVRIRNIQDEVVPRWADDMVRGLRFNVGTPVSVAEWIIRKSTF